MDLKCLTMSQDIYYMHMFFCSLGWVEGVQYAPTTVSMYEFLLKLLIKTITKVLSSTSVHVFN